jgi:hypothetical protein
VKVALIWVVALYMHVSEVVVGTMIRGDCSDVGGCKHL